jgi:hypothetical protein
MDTPRRVTLAEANQLIQQDFDEFSTWYLRMARIVPYQFPLAQPQIAWLMAMRGWKYLRDIPPGEVTTLNVPQGARSWYDLNITDRPFLVTVGEIATILKLADLNSEIAEFIRRVRDLIEWPDGAEWDEGQLFHIAQEYINPTTAMSEMMEE